MKIVLFSTLVALTVMANGVQAGVPGDIIPVVQPSLPVPAGALEFYQVDPFNIRITHDNSPKCPDCNTPVKTTLVQITFALNGCVDGITPVNQLVEQQNGKVVVNYSVMGVATERSKNVKCAIMPTATIRIELDGHINEKDIELKQLRLPLPN